MPTKEELEKENATLKTSVETLQGDINTLTTEKGTLEQKALADLEKIAELEKELQTSNETIAAREATIEQLAEEIQQAPLAGGKFPEAPDASPHKVIIERVYYNGKIYLAGDTVHIAPTEAEEYIRQSWIEKIDIGE